MTTPLRRLLLPLSLVALAIPASAAADTGRVAPPGGSGDSFSAAAEAAADPGCRSSNVIEFEQRTTLPEPRYAVRHAGRVRCEVPIRSRCHATLFREGVKVSEIGNRGRNRCRMASDFFGKHPAGTGFRENYSYRLTLRRERQRWAGTSQFCPKRTNHRRTLVCRDSHATVAPRREVDKHT